MTHRYVFQNLDEPGTEAADLTADQLRAQPGHKPLALLTLPWNWLDPRQGQTANHEMRQQCVNDLGFTDAPVIHDPSAFTLENGKSYTLQLDEQQELIRIGETLVKERGKFLDASTHPAALAWLPGPALRSINNELRNSHLDRDLIAQYLVWDCGNVALEFKTITQDNAWIGSGWAALKTREVLAQQQDANRFDATYQALSPVINASAEQLVRRYRKAAGRESDASVADWVSPQALVAFRLLRYLPRHKIHGLYNLDFRSGLLPLYGPAAWVAHVGWRHEMFDELERDLIFENWLTPFRHADGNWSLHPASLMLLYWAGHTMGIWETPLSAQEFLDQHAWKNWFGGRLDHVG